MTLKLKTLVAATCSALGLGWSATATAQVSDDVVKIGFITDISGPYSDTDGTGGVEAVKMAIEDFGAAAKGMKVGHKIVSGEEVAIENGNRLPLKNIPVGSTIYAIELQPGKGAQLAKIHVPPR